MIESSCCSGYNGDIDPSHWRLILTILKKRSSFVMIMVILSAIFISCNGFDSFIDYEKNPLTSLLLKAPKIFVYLFRGVKRSKTITILKIPFRYITRNETFLQFIEMLGEVRLLIKNTPWLYWTMLFLPFYTIYALIQETLLKLRNNVKYLKEECSLKSNFINWQNCMHIAMHQRMAELRIEVKTLSKVINCYRQNAKENELSSIKISKSEDRLSKSYQETPNNDNHELAQKNKSESAIAENKNIQANDVIRPKPRPKSEESPSENKKRQQRAWLETRKRILERSKEHLRNRMESVRKVKEDSQTSEEVKPDNKLLALREETESEKRVVLRRSKFTETKTPEEPTLGSNMSKLTKRLVKAKCDIKSEMNASVVDILNDPEQSIKKPANQKRRSLSDADAKHIIKHGSLQQSTKSHSESLPDGFITKADQVVANLEIGELGRVTSYTEIYKKKVLVAKSGKGPEITIEGKRRWCF